VKLHFYLAAACFACFCVINFVFEIMFDVQFNSTNLPVENALQVKKWDAKKKAENKA
jgi:hypothetical protein